MSEVQARVYDVGDEKVIVAAVPGGWEIAYIDSSETTVVFNEDGEVAFEPFTQDGEVVRVVFRRKKVKGFKIVEPKTHGRRWGPLE